MSYPACHRVAMCSLQVFLMGQKGIMQVGYLFLWSTQSCGVSCASYTPFPDVFSTQLSCCWLKHFSCPYKPLNLLTKCSRSGYQTEVFSGMLLLQEDSDFLSVFSCWFPPPPTCNIFGTSRQSFLIYLLFSRARGLNLLLLESNMVLMPQIFV